MSELLDLAVKVVGRARSGEEIEAFVMHEREFSVKVYGGEVESLTSAEPRGAGIRVFVDHRVGFAYTTDLTEPGLDNLIDRARDNAAHTSRDEALALADPWEERPPDIATLFDESQSTVAPEEKVRFALELERLTKAADPRIRTVEDAAYADADTEIGIATSRGITGAYRRSDAWCLAVAIATEADDTQVGLHFDLARAIRHLDPADVGRQAADRAVRVLGASKIRSTRLPVVFEPYVAGQFLGVLGRALTGEAVHKGRSLFAGRIGKNVGGAGVSLIDDGRAEGAPGAAPWDAEGVPTRRTAVIRDGVLESFLYDTRSARREGRSSTGNATRSGFKSPPGPSPSNLAFDTTGIGREEVLRRAGRCFVVQDFHGVHSGANPVSGDFSVGATGRLFEGGAPGRPVKEVTIALPMLDILASIEAIADDRRWLPFGGSYGGATTLVAEMTVAGA